ncbi:RagB/SusD family nutrient uptake outer membrane protein [Pedobacter alpinus]|uniref:RagB/SusD family nutrient uptake outer membrane protein n=1 Tax=Pedobacter alpinus TaxID=1590643 RepID=A0ABW5TUU7_9SPHI
MMKKRNINFLLFLGILIGLQTTSCTRDFLEKPKGGSVTVDTIFHTQRQAQYAVAQMYNRCITGYLRTSSPGHARPDVLSDALYILHPSYDWSAAHINYGTYVTGNMSAAANNDWGGFGSHYSGIRQANLVLKNIDMVGDADPSWKSDVKGQALFCRAIQHYELFKNYGGIPIVTQPLDGNGQIDIRRSSVASVVDSIVAWCDRAAILLPPTRSSIDYGKVTKLAALALKSRVLLYAASPLFNTPPSMVANVTGARFGDVKDSVLCYPTYDKERWNRAAKAAKAVIDNAAAAGVEIYDTGKPLSTGETYETIGDYEAVSNVFANKELILVNTANASPSGNPWGDGTAWGRFIHSKVGMLKSENWGVKNNVPIEFMQLYEKRDGTRFTLPSSGNDLPVDIKAFDLDPRFYQTVAYDGMYYNAGNGNLAYYKKGDYSSDGRGASSDAGVDGYAMETYKFVARIDGGSWDHFSWPVFRLGEFYLSYAEALNEYQGPSGDPTTYLNLIRKRAGMPAKNIGDDINFRAAIQNERAVELAYEGLRLDDLRRWLRAGTVLNRPLNGIVTTARNVGGDLKRTWTIVPFIQRVFPSKYYYSPFPNDEISKNYLGDGSSWTGQNPGW